MRLAFEAINYSSLNSRQQENYNYQKVSAVLADYGYMTIRLSDDWGGADFIAQHVNGDVLKVQLKGRAMVTKAYEGKDLWICFNSKGTWYLYPHDLVLEQMGTKLNILNTDSWKIGGAYSFPTIGLKLAEILAPFKIPAI